MTVPLKLALGNHDHSVVWSGPKMAKRRQNSGLKTIDAESVGFPEIPRPCFRHTTFGRTIYRDDRHPAACYGGPLFCLKLSTALLNAFRFCS